MVVKKKKKKKKGEKGFGGSRLPGARAFLFKITTFKM
jgi:hypothetical protein